MRAVQMLLCHTRTSQIIDLLEWTGRAAGGWTVYWGEANAAGQMHKGVRWATYVSICLNQTNLTSVYSP